jgi:hypothetical protein
MNSDNNAYDKLQLCINHCIQTQLIQQQRETEYKTQINKYIEEFNWDEFINLEVCPKLKEYSERGLSEFCITIIFPIPEFLQLEFEEETYWWNEFIKAFLTHFDYELFIGNYTTDAKDHFPNSHYRCPKDERNIKITIPHSSIDSYKLYNKFEYIYIYNSLSSTT